jgi:hypothetical protein
MELEFFQQVFEKYSNIKFHDNPSCGSQVVPYRRTDGWTDREIDMMKLIVGFCSSVNAPKNNMTVLMHEQNEFCSTCRITGSILHWFSDTMVVQLNVYDAT